MSETDNTAFITELNRLYEIVGRVTIHQYNTPKSEWRSEGLNTHLDRATKIQKHLLAEGYEYDWYKGWTKEMVTTPLTSL